MRPARPPQTARAGARSTGPDGAAVVVAVVGVAFGAWVWGTGELAGWLMSTRWPSVSPAAVPAITLRLPNTVGAPRHAWPASVRPSLPGAVLFDLTGLALLAVGGAAAWGGWRLWSRFGAGPAGRGVGGGGPGSGPPVARRVSSVSGHPGTLVRRRGRRGARWATAADLRALRPAGEGRLVLGRVGRVAVATEARHSVLVLGPTQSGKTSGLAIPAILEWPGPVVATSVKDDLASVTMGWRATRGPCWVFDPTATSGLSGRSGWSPLVECEDWSAAQRMAGWLVDAAPARAGATDGAFWFAAAAKQLAPLLLAAQRRGHTMAAVVRWNNLGDFEEPAGILDAARDAEAAVALYACAARDDRIRSSVATTLETVLAPFEDPTVAASTASCQIDPIRLLDGAATLYLCGPSYEQARVQGLFAALVSSVVATAVARANSTGRPLDPPLLLVLDEAANIAPLRDLDTLASTGAGLGIQLVTVCQDLSQLGTRYGAERARTIANNHRAKIILSGVADLSTLDLLSGLAGDQALREETVTHDLRDGRKTRSSATTFRRLAPADELRRIPPGQGVLVYGHLPPARLHLRPWFDDRTLRARAASG